MAGRKQDAPSGLDPLAEFTHGHHFAGNVAAQDMRHGELQAGDTGAHKEIEMIQGSRANGDAHLSRAGYERVGNIADL